MLPKILGLLQIVQKCTSVADVIQHISIYYRQTHNNRTVTATTSRDLDFNKIYMPTIIVSLFILEKHMLPRGCNNLKFTQMKPRATASVNIIARDFCSKKNPNLIVKEV